MSNTSLAARSAPFIAALLAASVLVVSGVADARDRGGKNGGRDNDRNNTNSELIWKRHENGCAIGNDPPPGANCTNRNDTN